MNRFTPKLAAGIILGFLGCSSPSLVYSQSVVYAPRVGQQYVYGIEIRIKGKNEGQRVTAFGRSRYSVHTQDFARVHLVLNVTEVDPQGWTAQYKTLSQNGDFEDPTRLAPQPQPTPPIPRPSTGLPSMDRIQRIMELEKAKDKEAALYPGKKAGCVGTIRVSPSGEVLGLEGAGGLPLLAGHIAKIPMMRLPPPEYDGVSEFGYRDINRLTVLFGENERRESSYSLLSVAKPADATSDKLIAYDRELEIAGGATAGTSIEIRGKGLNQFSTEKQMPFNGTLVVQSDRVRYNGLSGQFVMRIGFQLLNRWRGTLFRLGLLPAKTALDPEELPRLKPADTRSVQRQLAASDGAITRDLSRELTSMAPPPIESRLSQDIQRYIANPKEQSEDAVPGNLGNIRNLEKVADRWRELRQVATLIPRSWSDASDSFHVDATLVSRDIESVRIRRVDTGKIVSLELQRLSPKDAEFAMTFGMPTTTPR